MVELATEHADQVHLPRELARLAREAGGSVYASATPGLVASLEPGTTAAGIVLARWSDSAVARRVATTMLVPLLRERLPAGAIPTVLLVESLPETGLPDLLDVPTRASVPVPPTSPRNVFLIVRGRAWDAGRLDQYRDVILPMHKERGGLYEAFATTPAQVEALSGVWTEEIFAVSRWPSRAAAEDFWFCDRYQTQAIPLRLGAGRFSVHLIEACDP